MQQDKKAVLREIRKYHAQQIGLNINGKGRVPHTPSALLVEHQRRTTCATLISNINH